MTTMGTLAFDDDGGDDEEGNAGGGFIFVVLSAKIAGYSLIQLKAEKYMGTAERKQSF